jgi:hypothetical protein
MMKTKPLGFTRTLLAAAVLSLALERIAPAVEPTAFELMKLGDQYLGVQSKGKVVQIRSEKSIATLTPNIWHIVYYDPDATFRAVEVKFGAGQKLDVSHPGRVLEMFTDERQVLDAGKLKIDSDQALRIAEAHPLLKHLTLKATQLRLERGDSGPQWRVKFWAARLRHPNEDADIGSVILSSIDGAVRKVELHPNRVD